MTWHRELFHRHTGNPILRAEMWPYPVNSVFNAAVAAVGNRTLLLVRAEDFRGISHFSAATSADGVTGWKIDEKPTFKPEPDAHPEEIWGIEDPRLTWLEEEGRWVIAYTAYSEGGPLVALACTRDFRDFERIGAVMPPEDKDAAIFPVKFGGRYAMIHRPISTYVRLGAHMWLSFSPDLRHWGDHVEIIPARRGAWWDANRVGLSAPPLETDEGWLILYHGVRTTASGSIYRLGLAILDRDDPTRLTHRTDEWVFGPKAHYEREGDVDDVVFPCGWLRDGGDVRVYYGAADLTIALATARLAELLDFAKQFPV